MKNELTLSEKRIILDCVIMQLGISLGIAKNQKGRSEKKTIEKLFLIVSKLQKNWGVEHERK